MRCVYDYNREAKKKVSLKKMFIHTPVRTYLDLEINIELLVCVKMFTHISRMSLSKGMEALEPTGVNKFQIRSSPSNLFFWLGS